MFKKFCRVKKLEDEHVPATLSHNQKIDMSIMSFQVTPFCLGNLNTKQRENKQVLAKKAVFDHLHQTLR